MPTPSDSTDALPLQASCPSESDRPGEWRAQVLDRIDRVSPSAIATVLTSALEQCESSRPSKEDAPAPPKEETSTTPAPDEETVVNPERQSGSTLNGTPDIFSSEQEKTGSTPDETPTSSALDLALSPRLGVEGTRLIQTSTSSMLRAGSKFRGLQQSEINEYYVEVEIKTVDLAESSLCGFLRIEGLTPDCPSLTTCFDGEIIGAKYTFQTRHEEWGASDKEDIKAWARFPAWRAVGKQAKKSADFHYKNSTNRENIFMRWKEKFLVPDHKVREISGASFEGFYYICFNQVHGTITGIYYHSKSDSKNNKVQQLDLKWVDDRGCHEAFEFR